MRLRGKQGATFDSPLCGGGEHHVTVPAHTPLRIGTLNAIVDVTAHLGMAKEDLFNQLFRTKT